MDTPNEDNLINIVEERISASASYILDEMASVKNAQVNASIVKKYSLNDEQAAKMIKLIGLVILKIIPLADLPDNLAKNLSIDGQRAKEIAKDISLQRFLSLRNHLSETESFIKNLGGQLPQNLPAVAQEQKPTSQPAQAAAAAPQEIIIQKDINSAINEKPEVAIQNISEKPIESTDSTSLKMPSIRNWLANWRQYKSQYPEQDLALVRGRYLYESQNGKNLSEPEKAALNQLLKSADEKISLPFSQKTGLLLIEKLVQSPLPVRPPVKAIPMPAQATPAKPSAQAAPLPSTQTAPPMIQNTPPAQAKPPIAQTIFLPAKPLPTKPPIPPTPAFSPLPAPSQPPTKPPIQPASLAPPASAAPKIDYYHKKVDLPETKPLLPPKPAPRIEGNIINLKGIDKDA